MTSTNDAPHDVALIACPESGQAFLDCEHDSVVTADRKLLCLQCRASHQRRDLRANLLAFHKASGR